MQDKANNDINCKYKDFIVCINDYLNIFELPYSNIFKESNKYNITFSKKIINYSNLINEYIQLSILNKSLNKKINKFEKELKIKECEKINKGIFYIYEELSNYIFDYLKINKLLHPHISKNFNEYINKFSNNINFSNLKKIHKQFIIINESLNEKIIELKNQLEIKEHIRINNSLPEYILF